MAGERIAKIIIDSGKKPNSTTTDFLYGVVTSSTPLRIKIDGRFEVGEDFLILSMLCQEKIVTIPPSTQITLWEGLAVNDIVKLLRINSGQTYYVMEKEAV